jgi:tight adherence protein C
MLLLLIAAACLAGSAYAVAEIVTLPARERRLLVRRAGGYDASRAKALREAQPSLSARVLIPLSRRIAALMLRLNRRQSVERVQLRLAAAGMGTVSPSGFIAAQGTLAMVGILFGLVVWAATGIGALGFALTLSLAAGGYVAPGYFVGVRTRRRRNRVQAELPDALDLLAVSVEAGLGFDAAVQKLIDNMHGALIDELALTHAQMLVGESRQEALRKLSARVDSPELASFVRAIIQADQLGISLGKILRIQAVEVRLKRQAAAEEKAMKAPIKMLFPTVLFIFPAMFIVILGPALINLGKLFGF